MADPGIVDRVADAFRPGRRDILKQRRDTVKALSDEREAERARYDQVRDDADRLERLERLVDVTSPEQVTAAEEYAEKARTVADAAFAGFTTTVGSQLDRLNASKPLGRSRELEDALHGPNSVESLMGPAREKFENGLHEARAIVITARADLQKLKATTAPGEAIAAPTAPEKVTADLREPQRAPKSSAKLRERAKDTLLRNRAVHRRRAAAERRGKGHS
jgi:hypothetical protein